MSDDLQLRLTELERKVNALNKLAEISYVLSTVHDLDTLLAYAVSAASSITGAEYATLLLWDDQWRELRCAMTNAPETANAPTIGQRLGLDGCLTGQAFSERQVLMGCDVARGQTINGTPIILPSLAATPLIINDQVIGVMEVVNKRQLPWTDDDRDYVSVLASQTAAAIAASRMLVDLEKARRERQEFERVKTQFIDIASHELRTPLGIILGYAGYLQAEADGDTRELLTKVLQGALHLRQIIEGLTNLSQLQEGQGPIRLLRVPYSLRRFIEDNVQEVLELSDAHHHQIEVLYPPRDVQLLIDTEQAGLALNNVLNNAIKFTPDGGHIVITTEVRPQNQEAWIVVMDNGVGFAADQAERIFDKFYQVEDHMTRRHGGLGIGLSIARAAIEAHGGRIWAFSPGENAGVIFTITLPIVEEY